MHPSPEELKFSRAESLIVETLRKGRPFDREFTGNDFSMLVRGGLSTYADALEQRRGVKLSIMDVKTPIREGRVLVTSSGQAQKRVAPGIWTPSIAYELSAGIRQDTKPGRLFVPDFDFEPDSFFGIDIRGRVAPHIEGDAINDLLFEGLQFGLRAKGVDLTYLGFRMQPETIFVRARGGPAR